MVHARVVLPGGSDGRMIPRAYLERFAREHPRLAVCMLVWVVALWIFIGWVVVDDWLHGR
jgi:hypothetical protein